MNKQEFGMIGNSQVEALRVKLHKTNEALQLNPFDLKLKTEKRAIYHGYIRKLDVDMSFIKQKPKLEWLHYGEENTKTFYDPLKQNVIEIKSWLYMTNKGTCRQSQVL